MMIEPTFKVIRGAETSHGVFEWTCVCPAMGLDLRGKSRQPLLDACRQIKHAVGSTDAVAAIFRDGRTEADLSCHVEAGAALTVSEPDKGRIKFVAYSEWKPLA